MSKILLLFDLPLMLKQMILKHSLKIQGVFNLRLESKEGYATDKKAIEKYMMFTLKVNYYVNI